MIIYRCIKRFMCTPLERFLPVGARIARYENATRLVIDAAPRTDQDQFNIFTDGFIYVDAATVTWFYEVEPPPKGTNTDAGLFVKIGEKEEDAYGNVGTGLPANSKLEIATDGTPYFQNVTTLLWHPLRVNGPDGTVWLELGQNGVANVP